MGETIMYKNVKAKIIKNFSKLIIEDMKTNIRLMKTFRIGFCMERILSFLIIGLCLQKEILYKVLLLSPLALY